MQKSKGSGPWVVLAVAGGVAAGIVGSAIWHFGRRAATAAPVTAPAQAPPPTVAPTEPSNPEDQPTAASSWDEFRARDTRPMLRSETPHAPAWCMSSVSEGDAPEDEAVSCHPTAARCQEVWQGENEAAREQHVRVTTTPCRETRTLWCARTLLVDHWMCRSTEALCVAHLEAMKRVARGYRDGRVCEERWVQ